MIIKKYCLEKFNDKIIIKLEPIKKWASFKENDYVIEANDLYLFNKNHDRVPFNFRLACVLFFKYGVSLTNASKYSDLYFLRSTSVAHLDSEKGREVLKSDIIKAIELLEILIK
jgi:hypothetical protein